MTTKVFVLLIALVTASRGQQTRTANDVSQAQTVHQLFIEDQADREAPGGDLTKLDWSKIALRDEARRKQVRAFLAAGQLRSGLDFREASLILQHGSQPDDFLMAHILAMVALARGDQGSRWIAAATLDRYLHNISQKQVFGTQYRSGVSEPMTQEPFNRALVPVSLREALCVPNDHIQQIMLEAFRQNRQPDLSKFQSEMPCEE